MHIYMSWCALCVRVCVCACVCACVCVCVCVCVELNTRVHAWPWVPPHHAHKCSCNALQHTATHTATQGYRRLSGCPCIIRTRVSTTHRNTLQYTATHTATQVFRRLPGFCHIMRTRLSATYCNTLQHTAICYKMLQRTLQHRGSGVCLGSGISCAKGVCNTLQRTATHCNTLQHAAT